tara:strand:+ start:795 stop:1007 length:213 start_codon:yes stop_codon:yes gene_type:complete
MDMNRQGYKVRTSLSAPIKTTVKTIYVWHRLKKQTMSEFNCVGDAMQLHFAISTFSVQNEGGKVNIAKRN